MIKCPKDKKVKGCIRLKLRKTLNLGYGFKKGQNFCKRNLSSSQGSFSSSLFFKLLLTLSEKLNRQANNNCTHFQDFVKGLLKTAFSMFRLIKLLLCRL